MKAIWNGVVLAESEACRIVERNYYFPSDSVRHEYLRPSETHTTCFWKGVASYCAVVVDGKINRDAAWYYPETKPAYAQILGAIRGAMASREKHWWHVSLRVAAAGLTTSSIPAGDRVFEGVLSLTEVF